MAASEGRNRLRRHTLFIREAAEKHVYTTHHPERGSFNSEAKLREHIESLLTLPFSF